MVHRLYPRFLLLDNDGQSAPIVSKHQYVRIAKVMTLVRIRIREVFEETLGVRSQAEGRIIGLNLNDWRQRVSGCGCISAQSLICILILQKIYILSTTDQASLHNFGDYNLND